MFSALCIQVGVDPRLRELAQRLLLAVTNAEAIEEAVLVLMTDAAADTAAQVTSAAEQLTPMLEQGPAAQAGLIITLECIYFMPILQCCLDHQPICECLDR